MTAGFLPGAQVPNSPFSSTSKLTGMVYSLYANDHAKPSIAVSSLNETIRLVSTTFVGHEWAYVHMLSWPMAVDGCLIQVSYVSVLVG
jgi:hypothetical protein